MSHVLVTVSARSSILHVAAVQEDTDRPHKSLCGRNICHNVLTSHPLSVVQEYNKSSRNGVAKTSTSIYLPVCGGCEDSHKGAEVLSTAAAAYQEKQRQKREEQDTLARLVRLYPKQAIAILTDILDTDN